MKNKILLLIIVATLGLTTVTMAQVPSFVPTNGLVGYWPFNGNANDESGNNLNGTLIGSPQLSSDRFGNNNQAYDFNYLNAVFSQQNQEIYIPYNSILDVNNITVSYWIFPRSYYWSGNPNLTVNITRFQYGYSNPNGQVWGIGFTDTQVLGALNGPNGGGTYYASYNSPITLNTWNHIVLTFDGINIKLFLNGNLIATTQHALAMNTSGNSGISIGENNSANGYWQYTDGIMDDIGIWNRALTQQEISDLYNGCQLAVNTQPLSQNIYFNSNAQFIVGSSDTNATYQWQTNLGLGFQNLNNAGQYNGTTNDTLTVANVAMNNNNQQFRCIINSGSCVDTSNVAILSVNNCQLAVNAQPANQTININNNAQFIVGSSDPNATYQWQTNLGLGFQNVSNAGQYSGASNDTLSVSNVTMSNNNQQFRCIINSGSCADTSNVAVLTINNNVGIHEMDQHNLFSVFPNPAHNIINVKADHKLIGSVFTIYDNTGKAVQSGKINAANTSIELSNLSSGFYLFSVGNHVKQPFNVIKE